MAVAVLVAALLLVACGGDSIEEPPPAPRATPTPATAPTPAPTAEPEPPKELRVAFINLYSPLALDANNQVASDTFDERLEMVTKELKEFNPDIVGFNEASWTKAHGSAAARLAKELKMEPQYARANPWFPGQKKEESDEAVKLFGFEEGELILVRSDRYPVLQAERRPLNPRTSESGEGRAALHVVVKGPPAIGKIDVYITHLTGGGDKIRAAQAADFTSYIASTRGAGPVIVMQGGSDPTAGSNYETYAALGLHDVAGKDPVTTCCRESVLGEQPPLKARTDFLMWAGWKPANYLIWGVVPKKRADGTLLYASDHSGLAAVFPVEAVGAVAP